MQALLDIKEVASRIGIGEEHLERYGRYMAKVSLKALEAGSSKPGKLVLVTAMNPTPAGEGKTTTTIGLGQALFKLGVKTCIAIREPSLGPCFGIKGGATGGGRSKVEPSDKINLLFTSDFPAVSAAHNLLSAMINNHIYHGNELGIDPYSIVFPRTIDMNDRSLRSILVGVGGRDNGILAADKFVITPASEIMAILGLSSSYEDLKNRLGNIMVAFTYDKKPVYAKDLKAAGAMAAVLSDALKPNLVQTTEGVPAFIHTGPFGNIAHGTSSLIADRMALGYTDILVTEAGFGSELGAEKFFDLVSRMGDLPIDAVVIVATIRSMIHHGSQGSSDKDEMLSLREGTRNVIRHVKNMRKFGIEPVVALNIFDTDTEEQKKIVKETFDENKINWAYSEVYIKGGDGGISLAKKVMESLKVSVKISRIYDLEDSVETKIEKVSKIIYGAAGVQFDRTARNNIARIKRLKLDKLPICMAKTQYSLSDNPALLNDPEGFTVNVKSIGISAGAGFLVPYLGDIMTMPGLPKAPAAENVDIDGDGDITGLF